MSRADICIGRILNGAYRITRRAPKLSRTVMPDLGYVGSGFPASDMGATSSLDGRDSKDNPITKNRIYPGHGL
jgi:hypothetical protein